MGLLPIFRILDQTTLTKEVESLIPHRDPFLYIDKNGDVFRMVITNIKIADKYIKQSGQGMIGDQTAMDLSWICVKFQ